VVKVLLILAAVVDVTLAALLIGVSGFLFGSGPESMHSGAGFLVAYMAAVIACIAAPIVGFVFMRYGRPTPGIMISWMPTAGALLAMMLPPPY
jgi:hypothetical protein